jgi:hypothetical protein
MASRAADAVTTPSPDVVIAYAVPYGPRNASWVSGREPMKE